MLCNPPSKPLLWWGRLPLFPGLGNSPERPFPSSCSSIDCKSVGSGNLDSVPPNSCYLPKLPFKVGGGTLPNSEGLVLLIEVWNVAPQDFKIGPLLQGQGRLRALLG